MTNRTTKTTRAMRALSMLPLAVVGARCAPLTPTHRQPAVYLDCEVGCKTVPNLTPPTRLDVWMNGGGTLAQIRDRCDSMGGHDLVGVRHTHNLVCEQVDY